MEVKNPNNLPLIDYREIRDLQGDLKDLSKQNYAKAVKSLGQFGFFIPFYVWMNEGVPTCIDGHQRLRILKKEKAQPYKLPYLVIEADSLEEAKQKLLVVSSQYGEITQEGFDAFTVDLDEDWLIDTTHFDTLFRIYEEEDEPKAEKPTEPKEPSDKMCKCPECGYEFVK